MLPEDVEERVAKIQETISLLEGRSISLDKEVKQKQDDLNLVNSSILRAKQELETIEVKSQEVSAQLADREAKVAQKESALDVYANALTEKEKKINKYLSIFENIKDIVN